MFDERAFDEMELEAEAFVEDILLEFEQKYKGARYGGYNGETDAINPTTGTAPGNNPINPSEVEPITQ